jgi:hypothetical protein
MAGGNDATAEMSTAGVGSAAAASPFTGGGGSRHGSHGRGHNGNRYRSSTVASAAAESTFKGSDEGLAGCIFATSGHGGTSAFPRKIDALGQWANTKISRNRDILAIGLSTLVLEEPAVPHRPLRMPCVM